MKLPRHLVVAKEAFDHDPKDRSSHQVMAINTNVTLVVPCYNEAERLDTEAYKAFLDVEKSVSMVMVNDGSTDATLSKLLELRLRFPHQITVLDIERNHGKQEAVRLGLSYAASCGDEIIGYWDADLATPLSAVVDFVNVLNRLPESEVVFGSRRRLLGHRIERTILRRVISRSCNLMARAALVLPVGDTQCGAKMLRNTQAFRTAIARPFSSGWLFDVELFARIRLTKYDRKTAFYELPLLEWNEVPGSKVTMHVIMKSTFHMLRLIIRMHLCPHKGPATVVSTSRN